MKSDLTPKLLDRKSQPHETATTANPVPVVRNNYDKLRAGIVKTLLLVMQHRREAAHDVIDRLMDELEFDANQKVLPSEDVSHQIIEELNDIFGKNRLKKITAIVIETDERSAR